MNNIISDCVNMIKYDTVGGYEWSELFSYIFIRDEIIHALFNEATNVQPTDIYLLSSL